MRGVLNFDDPTQQDTIIAITYRGVKMAVSKDRLIELMQSEQDYLQMRTHGGGAGADDGDGESGAALRGRQLQLTNVTHASLSSRIKKVYMYSAATRVLRPAHLGLLKELLQNFDWQIPQYPNTRLEQHLQDIRGWSGVPDDFKAEIDQFLKRYLAARRAS